MDLLPEVIRPEPVAPESDAARLSERAKGGVQRLVAAAARALGADGATFVGISRGLKAVTIADGLALDFIAPGALTRAALENRLLVIERSEPADPTSSGLHAAGIRFFASACVGAGNPPPGYLAIFGRDPRALSGAQEYVLLTFAAEISDQLEFDELRTSVVKTQLREELRAERLRLLESVVVNANDAVLITEAEPVVEPGPRIVFANAAFTRTTGYELHEVVGLTPRILQGPNTDDAARKRLREALHAWEAVEVQLLNYHKDGTPFWVELSIVPVADETGYFTHWVSVQRDVSERKAAEDSATRALVAEAANTALEYRAFHDELTGLRNRAFLNDRIQMLLEGLHAGRGRRFFVLFFDLDRFKVVNDSLGHRVGDLLLVELARRLESCVGPRHTIGRVGGDEFGCVIEAHELNDVVAVADRILAELGAPIRLAGQEIFASASIGIAHVDERYADAVEVFRDADTAMYRAKRSGGMRYELFHETMHERALAALRVQMDLRGAVDRGEFVLHYQPLVNLADGHAYGVEALVRWQHPQRGLISPVEFIPIAEDTGLIVALGTWVLHEACRRMASWHAATPERAKLSLSVNVSSRQLGDARFFGELRSALAQSGLDPKTLQLEITESIFVERADDVGALLKRIRGLGVRIALDDFGTGYSSLSYLERFPLDTLKIDQSFVQRLSTKPATGEIVRLIIGLAAALGMDVVAEGIENDAQWEALRQYGCLRAQGYHFSRPVPAGEIAGLMGRALAQRPSGIATV